MMNRRTLLLGTTGLVAGSVLTGCNRAANPLQVELLAGAIPPEVLNEFKKTTQFPVKVQTLGQMQVTFQQLQRWQQTPDKPPSWIRWPWQQASRPLTESQRLVSLGDYWLKQAIAQDLIEPMPLPEALLAPLPNQWQQFVTRDADGQLPIGEAPTNSLWAAPYKVQSLVIVYRQSQVPQLNKALGRPESAVPFQQWRDLLNPVLRGRTALPNHPNLVIGLLQKLQTDRFNAVFDVSASRTSSVAALTQRLRSQLGDAFAELNQQVRTYDSTTALKALVNEDVQVVVTWSGDVQLALQRYRDLRVAMPEDGSLLSADMWVQPKGTELSEAAKAWIAFCWQVGPATQISVAGEGLSPIFLSESVLDGTSEQVSFPEALSSRRKMAEVMQRSELLRPLPDAMQAAYFSLWEQLRTEEV